MLVIKAFVNYHQIDEVWIHNMGESHGDIYEYRIEKPKGFENRQIYHARTDGWRILADKALKLMEQYKDEEVESFDEEVAAYEKELLTIAALMAND